MKITRSELLQLRLHRSKFKTAGKYDIREIKGDYKHPDDIFGARPNKVGRQRKLNDRRVDHAKHR